VINFTCTGTESTWHNNVSAPMEQNDSWATVHKVLPITNVTADSESHFTVTIRLSRLVSEISACDTQTDNMDHYYSRPAH